LEEEDEFLERDDMLPFFLNRMTTTKEKADKERIKAAKAVRVITDEVLLPSLLFRKE